jgi:hypothetical protein
MNATVTQPRKLKPRTRPARVDWFRVIVELERNGHPQRAIAELLGLSHGWVKHLKDSPGAEPRFDDGNTLIDLWCETMDKPPYEVPRERPSINRR